MNILKIKKYSKEKTQVFSLFSSPLHSDFKLGSSIFKKAIDKNRIGMWLDHILRTHASYETIINWREKHNITNLYDFENYRKFIIK